MFFPSDLPTSKSYPLVLRSASCSSNPRLNNSPMTKYSPAFPVGIPDFRFLICAAILLCICVCSQTSFKLDRLLQILAEWNVHSLRLFLLFPVRRFNCVWPRRACPTRLRRLVVKHYEGA